MFSNPPANSIKDMVRVRFHYYLHIGCCDCSEEKAHLRLTGWVQVSLRILDYH